MSKPKHDHGELRATDATVISLGCCPDPEQPHLAPSLKFDSHEAYFASSPVALQPVLLAIQASIQAAVPASQPCISYNMPAFRLEKTFIYFAAFRRHIGVYPPVVGSEPLRTRLAPFRGPKGNLIFPLDQPVPVELIANVAAVLAQEYGCAKPSP